MIALVLSSNTNMCVCGVVVRCISTLFSVSDPSDVMVLALRRADGSALRSIEGLPSRAWGGDVVF